MAELLEVVDGLLRALGNVLAGDAELLVDSLGRSGGTAERARSGLQLATCGLFVAEERKLTRKC